MTKKMGHQYLNDVIMFGQKNFKPGMHPEILKKENKYCSFQSRKNAEKKNEISQVQIFTP